MSQADEEVKFWRELYERNGEQGFLEIRRQDFQDKTEYFPELLAEKGVGLDLGSGLVSIFRFSNLTYHASDPLAEEFTKIYPFQYRKDINRIYDWIFCCNVIDHTPDPTELIDYLKTHLNGRLYFEVNFDDQLSPAHYKLWRIEDVREHFKDFKLIKERVIRNLNYPQSIYQAIYEIHTASL